MTRDARAMRVPGRGGRTARLALLALLGLASCRCRPPGTMAVTSEVSASPTALGFGQVPLGISLPLTVELRNGGLAPAPVALTVEGPFTLGDVPTQLEGAQSVTVSVTFSPTQLGQATGVLRLGAGLPTVALSGEGVAACVAADPCDAPVFDLTTRRCGSVAQPDGVPCAAPCLSGAGTCRGGYCLGQLSSCADTDACTIDACSSDGTCLHPPLDCQVSDPCQATYCEPGSGCAHQPVADGTPCGEATCETAKICLGGQCQSRTRPNALADCRYSTLSAGADHTCAVTAGGELRCWGDNSDDQQGRGYPAEVTPPGFAAGLSGLRSVAAQDRTTWVARAQGDVAQTNGALALPMDVAALTAGATPMVCGLEHGAVRCARTDSPDAAVVTTIAQDAISSSMRDDVLCVAHDDGGVRCGTLGALTPISLPAPATQVSSAGQGSGCALVGEGAWCWGAVVDGGQRLVWDAGVTALATTGQSLGFPRTACAATDRGVECTRANLPARLVTEPSLGRVTSLALGLLHGCALLADGRTACWGNNHLGQLGDRSAQPLGVQHAQVQASWLGAIRSQVLFASSPDTAQAFVASARTDDAGTQWLLPVPAPVHVPTASYDVGCSCALDAGACEHVPLPVRVTHCAGQSAGLCVSTADGTVSCASALNDGGVDARPSWNAGAVEALRSEWVGRGVCAVRRDGTVACRDLTQFAAVPPSLTGVKNLCFGNDLNATGGCAHLDGGVLQCWGGWVQSPTPRAPLGAWPAIRQLACGFEHFCTLSGLNIVQCWGDNQRGQLGRDGPASVQAVPVPMPEPVKSIAAGYASTCALLQSGRMVCWGDNSFGQLGVPVLLQSDRLRVVTQ